MNIRRATVNDAPQLAWIHVKSWQATYRGLVPDSFLAEFTIQRREHAFHQALATNLEETYLVEENGQGIGILTIGASRDADVDPKCTGELWGIYLVPDHWHRGIGTKLVQEAECMLMGRGYQDIILWVLEGNTSARFFYEKVGYREDGKSKILELGCPLKAVRYHKVLNVGNGKID